MVSTLDLLWIIILFYTELWTHALITGVLYSTELLWMHMLPFLHKILQDIVIFMILNLHVPNFWLPYQEHWVIPFWYCHGVRQHLLFSMRSDIDLTSISVTGNNKVGAGFNTEYMYM